MISDIIKFAVETRCHSPRSIVTSLNIPYWYLYTVVSPSVFDLGRIDPTIRMTPSSIHREIMLVHELCDLMQYDYELEEIAEHHDVYISDVYDIAHGRLYPTISKKYPIGEWCDMFDPGELYCLFKGGEVK